MVDDRPIAMNREHPRRVVRVACRQSAARVRRHAFGEPPYGLAAVALALLAACSDPQPEPIDPADAVTEEAIDPVPDGEFEALAVGERYDDVDGLVLAAVPMAPDVLVETEEREDGRLLIKIEAEGFEDDSIEAQRFDVIAEPTSGGLVVRKLDEMYKCYRDDSDEWTTALCP